MPGDVDVAELARRHEGRHGSPSVNPIDAEIFPISRDDYAAVFLLRECEKSRVGNSGAIDVAVEKFEHGRAPGRHDFSVQYPHQLEEANGTAPTASYQEPRFGKHSFACDERCIEAVECATRPHVVLFAPIQKGD